MSEGDVKTGADLVRDVDGLSVPPGAVAFWWLGQMGYIVKLAGRVLYFDPFLAPRPTRLVPPLLAPGDVTHADFVFGSHDHGDHIDPVAVAGIRDASPRAQFVCSRVSRRHLLEIGVPDARIVALDDGGSGEVEGLRISAIAAQHEFFDRDPDLGHPHLCFVVEGESVAVLHAGDTLRYDGMLARLAGWRFDVAFLPINGRDAARYARGCMGNMTYQEAVDLAGALSPRLTVPGHYDMFADNPGDPAAFAAYMDVKYPDLDYWIGDHGVAVVLGSRGA